MMEKDRPLRKPPWIKAKVGCGSTYRRMGELMRGQGLHTVCEEALCPNRGECWEHGRATLMILGGQCTRSCRFCNVITCPPPPLDPDEPQHAAEAVAQMGLMDVVVTSVTRDDLPDGGAAHWVATIHAIRERLPGVRVEVLVPDFGGNEAALASVLAARPDVFGHNVETVPSLYADVRPQATYARSLGVLAAAADANLIVKTGVMLGLGESREEVLDVMCDAREAGATIFYAGQYLQPSRDHAPVRRYWHPDEFAELEKAGLAMGFKVVVSAPLVRSSYHDERQQAYVTECLAAGDTQHG